MPIATSRDYDQRVRMIDRIQTRNALTDDLEEILWVEYDVAGGRDLVHEDLVKVAGKIVRSRRIDRVAHTQSWGRGGVAVGGNLIVSRTK